MLIQVDSTKAIAMAFGTAVEYKLAKSVKAC
jgi:hypothetical protein